jgi:hypothetical protein
MKRTKAKTPTKTPTKTPPAPPPSPPQATPDPYATPEVARAVHGKSMAGIVYANALAHRIAKMFPRSLTKSAMVYMEDLIQRMDPRDPVEEMLVVQLVLTHARVLHLTDYANRQESLEKLRGVNECADRASNTYRRLMLALPEYRRPPSSSSFTAIRQANFASQQLIQSNETGTTTNEQGCQTRETPLLSVDASGPLVPSRFGAAREAMAAIDRTPDPRGQG